jgi:nickel transport protein
MKKIVVKWAASPKSILTIVCLSALTTLLLFSHAQAHKINVFAWVEGDTVYVESKFSGGRKPVAASVEVYDTQDNLLLEGKTDDQGNFSFEVPRKTAMKVVLLAGMGHRGEWAIPISDLDDVDPGRTSSVPKITPKPPSSTALEHTGDLETSKNDDAVLTTIVTANEIKNVVEVTIDAKLKPIMKILVESQQKGPSVTDILGGIGYILGLVGVAAYFSSRRRKQ